MTHLSRKHLVEFVDDLDGHPDGRRLPPERRQHVLGCDACRREAAALSEVLSELRHAPVGEPSPLFWDHFAARVSQALGDESPAPLAHARGWGMGRQTAWTALGLAIVLGSTMVAWRATLHAPTVPNAARATLEAMRPENLDNDRAWDDVVRAAADGLQWDDVQAAGIAAGAGLAEGAMLEMTPDERDELVHLLETEIKIKRSGA